jgi:hypothetical protein
MTKISSFMETNRALISTFQIKNFSISSSRGLREGLLLSFINSYNLRSNKTLQLLLLNLVWTEKVKVAFQGRAIWTHNFPMKPGISPLCLKPNRGKLWRKVTSLGLSQLRKSGINTLPNCYIIEFGWLLSSSLALIKMW